MTTAHLQQIDEVTTLRVAIALDEADGWWRNESGELVLPGCLNRLLIGREVAEVAIVVTTKGVAGERHFCDDNIETKVSEVYLDGKLLPYAQHRCLEAAWQEWIEQAQR
jgi:hypothetical protein